MSLIETDLSVDLPAWLAHFLIRDLERMLANHARFVELFGD